MATLTRSVTIDAPTEKVFDLALDVGKFWTCSPEVALRDVKLTPDGVGTRAELWTHGFGVHFQGHIEYTEVTRPERIVAQVAFGPEKPVWVFTFEPADGGTQMTGQGEWHAKVPAVGKAFEEWMAKSHRSFLEALLDNFKALAEAEAA